MAVNKIEVAESKIMIGNERLKVGILKPGEFYKKERFDWTGFISDIILDDQHKFCVSHYDEAGDLVLGRGICNEFGMVIPIGMEDILIGEKYPKMGIGLVPKVEEADKNKISLKDIELFPKTVEVEADSVTFTTGAIDCRGYAAQLTKRISIKDNHLTIDYRLENVGSKSIETEEYCHNFVLINDHKVGPEYRLEMPFDIEADIKPVGMTSVMSLSQGSLTWKEVPSSVYFFRSVLESKDKGYWWKMTHQPTGVGMKEYGDFNPHMFAVWGKSHVVSPEVFVKIQVAPGETQSWKRQYEFFC